jgi:hypothetical protein
LCGKASVLAVCGEAQTEAHHGHKEEIHSGEEEGVARPEDDGDEAQQEVGSA